MTGKGTELTDSQVEKMASEAFTMVRSTLLMMHCCSLGEFQY